MLCSGAVRRRVLAPPADRAAISRLRTVHPSHEVSPAKLEEINTAVTVEVNGEVGCLKCGLRFGGALRRRSGVVSWCGAWLGVLPDKSAGKS